MPKAARRRKNKPGEDNKDIDSSAAPSSSAPSERRDKTAKSTPATANTDEKTAWEVFTQHPLIWVGKFIMPPYALYLAYFFFRLQHPEYLSKATAGIISLRPSVGIQDPRQLLIVASPSSGTVQMQKELKYKLGLEIGHETSDTAWHFVRDGTVSWFHGIRFLPHPNTKEEKEESIKNFGVICGGNGNYTKNMGFHPAAYRTPVHGCSYRSAWDDCWQKECYRTLLKEWGCGTSNNCEINFDYTLHQVRNPIRNIESLAVKFCVNGLDSGIVQEQFLVYAGTLFPHHNFHEDSCIEATGYFLVEYQNAMIEARKRGDISAFYRIEETTACEVAEMAGLLSSTTATYEPNYKKMRRICEDSNNVGKGAHQAVERTENKLNKDFVTLGWNDLRGGMHGSRKNVGNTDLEMKVKGLFKALGYDETLIEEEAKVPNAEATTNEL